MLTETDLMLKVISCNYGNSSLGVNWRGQSFNEDYARLYCVIDGSAEIWHSGRKFDIQTGKLFLVPPSANMKYRCKNSFKILWIHFNILIQGHIDIFRVHPFTFVYSHEKGLSLKDKFFELIDLLSKKDISAQFRSQAILLELISLFFIQEEVKIHLNNAVKLERFKKVIDYIDKHCAEKITLEKLAKIANYEKTYFSNLFKEIYSVSPIQYLIRRRLDKAIALLSNFDEKFSSIATETGFNDAFHFSKGFKKIYGKSPREFRKSLSKKIP